MFHQSMVRQAHGVATGKIGVNEEKSREVLQGFEQSDGSLSTTRECDCLSNALGQHLGRTMPPKLYALSRRSFTGAFSKICTANFKDKISCFPQRIAQAP